MTWHEIGPAEELKKSPLRAVVVAGRRVALSYQDGRFGAITGDCQHAGGPLGEGSLAGDYVRCPWHGWQFHRIDGNARPGTPAAVPSYRLEVRGAMLCITFDGATPARRAPHPPHPLARPIERAPGDVRVAGISTTAMNLQAPRYSTSDDLLEVAIAHARTALGCETQLIKLNQLTFRRCEGYYSKAAGACTWPCTITQMDPQDQLDRVYEALVHWADVVLVATPIRWGAASSLYFQMAERLNCIQNQITTHDRVLIRDKVAAFIVTGGQDNVQAVAGQMLAFFGELGFEFPPFPFVAHSRGWAAEDMENNVRYVQTSASLREGTRALAARAVERARALLVRADVRGHVARGGRKACRAEDDLPG